MVLDDRYLQKIKNTSFQPIFILGFHRSGTSVLYKILAETKKFNTITAYHNIKYDELLYNYFNEKENKAKQEINNYLMKHGQTDRGIDKLKLSSEFKEEYRFIFTNKNYKPKINQNNLELFKQMCKKIQYISKNDKPLLLKNPYDYPNFIFIKKNFPESKLIFIHRNPLKVINSNTKSFRNLIYKKNYYSALLSKDYKKIIQNPLLMTLYKVYLKTTTFLSCIHTVKQFRKKTDYFLENISKIDNEDYITLKYEDLCEKPDIEIEKIIKFLKIKPEGKINYSKKIKKRNVELIKELKILTPYIQKKLYKYNKYFNYRY